MRHILVTQLDHSKPLTLQIFDRIWVHAKYGYRLCFDKKQRSHHKNGGAPTVGALTTANLTKSTLSMASQTGNPVLFEVIKALSIMID